MFSSDQSESEGAQGTPDGDSDGPRCGSLNNAELVDDKDGYFVVRVGEVMNSMYKVVTAAGRGVFSSVLKAEVLASTATTTTATAPGGQTVVIKVVRSKDVMAQAALKEIEVLRLLQGRDPEGKMHVIRLLSHFLYKGHTCLVFEPMAMNLRDLLRRYGRSEGLNLRAVQVFARQLCISLLHLKRCGVLHADIKPDNICVDDNLLRLKLVDLGSASLTTDENPVTPYLVSRYYRAPEITLGHRYGHPIDMWSVACCLYELYTSHVLFPGKTSNGMVKCYMDVMGRMPVRMVKQGAFGERFFDPEGRFLHQVVDGFSGNVKEKPIPMALFPVPGGSLANRLTPSRAAQAPERALIDSFTDFLTSALQLDPTKRITPEDALNHPFIHAKPNPNARSKK